MLLRKPSLTTPKSKGPFTGSGTQLRCSPSSPDGADNPDGPDNADGGPGDPDGPDYPTAEDLDAPGVTWTKSVKNFCFF